MKKLTQEDDLTLIKEMEIYTTPSYKEMVFVAFMIILYYSNYARPVFWFLFTLTILCVIIYFFESLDKITTLSLVREELKRRGIYKK